MYEKSEQDPAREKYVKAQENIDALFNKMSQLMSHSCVDIDRLTSWEDVKENMAKLQMVLISLQEAKEQLLAVNLQVHRFTTEYGSDTNYKDCSLKDDITELYRQWEDMYEQSGAHLTELEALKINWEIYDEKYQSLRFRIKELEFNSDDNVCDNFHLISKGEKKNTVRKDFDELNQHAVCLERRLKGGDAWKKIEEQLNDLRRKIDRHEAVQKTLASLSANHRSPSTAVEEDADDHFEDAIQQLCDDNHSKLSTPQKKDVSATVSPKRRKGRFWRIVRIAVPVQVALVLLYCLACYLEPSCCSALNNFNFSFTPQLRYFSGRPPV